MNLTPELLTANGFLGLSSEAAVVPLRSPDPNVRSYTVLFEACGQRWVKNQSGRIDLPGFEVSAIVAEVQGLATDLDLLVQLHIADEDGVDSAWAVIEPGATE